MPRVKYPCAATVISCRIPDELLKQMQALADKNYHGRTAEINNACRYWIAACAEGHPADFAAESYADDENSDAEALPLFAKEDRVRLQNEGRAAADEITELQSAIQALREESAAERKETAASFAALQKETAALAESFEAERKLLLKIIEEHDTTIRTILQFADKKGSD